MVRVGQKLSTDTQSYGSELSRSSLAHEFLITPSVNNLAALIIALTMLTFHLVEGILYCAFR